MSARGGGDRRDGHERATYYRLPRPRRRWLGFVGWSLWAVTAVLTALAVGTYLFIDDTLSKASPDTPEVNAAIAATDDVEVGEPTNVLLIGADARPQEGDPGRSDSLILARIDPGNDYISMLSFPRDLYVDIPGYGQDKINAAFSLGGAKLTIETVKALTGAEINHYVLVDFTGFQRLVDQVGGVWIDVDRRYFNKNDGTAARNYADIDIQPGYQKLAGANALAYVRYRHTDSDFARIARQQMFLQELKRQTNKADNLLRFDKLSDVFSDNIQTSIRDPRKAVELLQAALTIGKDRTARTAVEGYTDFVGEASVVMADQAAIDEAVALWREPEFTDQGVNAVIPAETRVEVVNGSGQMLVADTAAHLLHEKGWDARPGGNAESFTLTSTEIRYAPGGRAAAQRLKVLMGPSARLRGLANDEAVPGVDVTVAVGPDWTGELQTPPKRQAVPKPKTTDTLDLVPIGKRLGQFMGQPVMVPAKVASGSSVRIVRSYSADGGRGRAPTAKMVFEAGPQEYWGFTMTTLKDPAILRGETGFKDLGGRRYFTYYDGRNMQRLAWKKDGVSYWISNSLDYALSAETMWAIAKSAREPGRVRLPDGAASTSISIETDGYTP